MWTHPKYKKNFKGSYVRFEVNKNGKAIQEFAFVLLSTNTKPITFNSYQDAKKAGWKRILA